MLVLEDGRAFRGRSFGAAGERTGEVVFNTAMTGYQEVPTDPSYRGQIVLMTSPEIGNYGTNPENLESAKPQVEIAARALGARTCKLKFGHHGSNHPVQDLRTVRVAVTSQNHGYAVIAETLPDSVELTHVNLNDETCEGFVDHDAGVLAVQYHPEPSPGPHDSFGLFGEFAQLVREAAGRERAGPEVLP